MLPLFELEPHREAEEDPRWKDRIRARNVILISAALIVPLGALMIMVALLLGDLDMATPRPKIIMVTSLVHPFMAAFTVLGSMYVHKSGSYWLAAFVALGSQVISFSIYLYYTVSWLIS